jgi:hypothetical protein
MANKYFKRNFKEALNSGIPTVYQNREVEVSGITTSQVDAIINSHLNFCTHQPSLLNISAVGDLSNINTASGISRWFLTENTKENTFNSRDFEVDILHKLGLCTGRLFGQSCTYVSPSSVITQPTYFGDTYTKILSFMTSSVLPALVLNSSSLETTTASAFDNTASGTHNHLINKLGWAYFLNTSAAEVSPSGYVASALTDMYVSGTNFSIKEGIKGLEYYLWNNWSSVSSVNSTLLPPLYQSATGEYTSGTATLDNLNTLVDIIYSEQIANKDDVYIKEAFDSYIDNGTLLDSQEKAGPFSKFIEGISYSIFDTYNLSEKLRYLYDLDNCPSHLLKHVAELIGWRLRGSDEAGWRRQLRYASNLYKQKGTKDGLYNAITTVLPGTGLDPSAISEFYESYIPYLMYYLLKTDSGLFTFGEWTPDKAVEYTDGEYSYSDMDYNIRVVIDHILLNAIKRFGDSFYIKTYKFDITDPDFQFFYRGRSFCIPPWEEIKFYRTCDLTLNLLEYLRDQLLCFGVSIPNAKAFYDYIQEHTLLNSNQNTYSNSFLFFTSSLNLAPNEKDILDKGLADDYDYLTLWNSKSSTFNVSVSSGSFDTAFFSDLIKSKKEFFQSLSIVDEFSPAKSIARTHVDLLHTDNVSGMSVTCPSVRFWMQDVTVSGFQGGSTASGMDMLNIPMFEGNDYPFLDNSGRARNDHTNLPVFKREQVDDPLDFAQLDGSSVSALPLSSNVFRTNIRRRNFSKTLEKGGWTTRTGLNMPSYFNGGTLGSFTDYYALGYVMDQYNYHPVVNYKNLYEVSGWPYNEPFWSDCYGIDSDLSYSGIPISTTFNTRGSTALSAHTCDNYQRRERTDEFVKFLFNLLDKKFTKEAERIYELNKPLIDVSSYLNPIESIKSDLWNKSNIDIDSYYDVILGKRIFSIGSIDGMHKMFKDYISYFTNYGIGNGLLTSYIDGGPNILSHAYGPLYYNGQFTVDGSGLEVSSNLVNTSPVSTDSFIVTEVSSLSNYTASTAGDMFVGSHEYRNPYLLSGVEFVDTIVETIPTYQYSDFSIYKISDEYDSPDRDNYNIDNPLVMLKNKGGFARFRFDLKSYGEYENFIIPERKFKLSINSLIGNLNSLTLGGGNVGVWIHTKEETDHHGNKVFWNLMPNGEWKIFNANVLTNKDSIDLVKNTLSHTLDLTQTYTPDGSKECFRESSNTEVLTFLQEKDFITKDIKFHTRNNKIRVPLAYYQSYQQVHRTDQNYIVEVFSYDSAQDLKFFLLDKVSLRDERQNSRTFVKHPMSYRDYSPRTKLMINDFDFYDSSGSLVSSGMQVSADINGNLTSSSGDNLTVHISNVKGPSISKGFLYTQLNLSSEDMWIRPGDSENLYYLASKKYNGLLTIGPSGTISSPSSITISGKKKGSNITKYENVFITLDKEEVLVILREFKRLQAEIGARDKAINASQFGPEGGSRLNYRFAPMWANEGGYSTFESDSRQYSKLYLEN